MAVVNNLDPLFAITPKFSAVQISTANANRDGVTGTYGTLFTATEKTQISEIRYVAAETTTAGMVRFFITDTVGTNPRMFLELKVAAVTASASVACATGSQTYFNFIIQAGQIITCSTEQAEDINCFIQVGELTVTT
jgi:hypothetical protein